MLISASQVCGHEGTGASRPWKVLYSTRCAGLDGVQPRPCGEGFKSCQFPVAPAKQAFSVVIGHGICLLLFFFLKKGQLKGGEKK